MGALAGAAGGGGGSIQGGDAGSKLSSSASATSGTGAKNFNIGGNPNVAVGLGALTKSPILIAVIVAAVIAYMHFRKKS